MIQEPNRSRPDDLDLDLDRAADAVTPARAGVHAARRVVIKLGTRVLTDDDGALAHERAAALVDAAAELRTTGREVVLVSSGAVGLGQRTLGLARACPHRGLRQACAAVGQAELMSLYHRELSRFSLSCGQVLVSADDFRTRRRALHLRRIVNTLLRQGVVPILNENDALGHGAGTHDAAEPHPFTDNDRLAAMVASEIGADLLVLLTDVPGLFEGDPRKHDDARLLARVDDPAQLPAVSSRPGTGAGRGGMGSKVEAALLARRSGCQTIIAGGRDAGALAHLLAGAEVGTWFPARGGLSARHRWIALTGVARGSLHLDDGAITALRDRSASLLPAGVRRVDGAFAPGDVVELSGDGTVVGRALARLGSERTRRLCAHPWSASGSRALIRSENIVMHERDGGSTR